MEPVFVDLGGGFAVRSRRDALGGTLDLHLWTLMRQEQLLRGQKELLAAQQLQSTARGESASRAGLIGDGEAYLTKVTLTLAECGKLLGISADQVRRLVDGGELQAFNVGAGGRRESFRVKRSEVEEFQKRRSRGKSTSTRRRSRRRSANLSENRWGL